MHERVERGEALSAPSADRADGRPLRRGLRRGRASSTGSASASPGRSSRPTSTPLLRLPVRHGHLRGARAGTPHPRGRRRRGRALPRLPLRRRIAVSARCAPRRRGRPVVSGARRDGLRGALVSRRPSREARLASGRHASARTGERAEPRPSGSASSANDGSASSSNGRARRACSRASSSRPIAAYSSASSSWNQPSGEPVSIAHVVACSRSGTASAGRPSARRVLPTAYRASSIGARLSGSVSRTASARSKASRASS